jgi:hypothetical protein
MLSTDTLQQLPFWNGRTIPGCEPKPLDGTLIGRFDNLAHGANTATIEADVWHDWWNASDRDARVRVEVTPGERFGHMIETLYGLARLGYTDSKVLPNPLQFALVVREFSDVIVFRSPSLIVQCALFGVLAPIARWRGYRATYPQLSRTVLAPQTYPSCRAKTLLEGQPRRSRLSPAIRRARR